MKNINYINGNTNFSFDTNLKYDDKLPTLPIGTTVSTRYTEGVIVGIDFIGCGFLYKVQTVKVKPGPDFITKHLSIGRISTEYDYQLTLIKKILV